MSSSRTLTREALDDLYLEWLYDQIGLPKRGRTRSYWRLFREMYQKEFVWTLENDGNRAEDGQELKWQFVRAARLPKVEAKWMYRPCSVLEMLFAVTRRMSALTDGEVRGWFMQLLFNLGLDRYNDAIIDSYLGDVDRIMETLIRRTYSSTGEGGLFPLSYPSQDQRGVEIWYQMNAWLIERERREG